MSPTFARPFLSIVIPAYNEEKRLVASLAKIASYVDAGGIDAEILVVDDGSKDRTAELAAKALAGRRGRVVPNGENRGKGYSVRHGVLEARGRFVLLTDADLSSPSPKKISEKFNSTLDFSDHLLSTKPSRFNERAVLDYAIMVYGLFQKKDTKSIPRRCLSRQRIMPGPIISQSRMSLRHSVPC